MGLALEQQRSNRILTGALVFEAGKFRELIDSEMWTLCASSLEARTVNGRRPPLQGGGCGFESHRAYQLRRAAFEINIRLAARRSSSLKVFAES